jgi:hypothetical protein
MQQYDQRKHLFHVRFPVAVKISSTRRAVGMATRRNEVVGGKSRPKQGDLAEAATQKAQICLQRVGRALVTVAFGVAVIQYAH